LITGTFTQKEITIRNTYGPSVDIAKFIKQILLDIKLQVGANTVIVGDFNTPPSDNK
jgi:hypothetical protein